MENTDPFPKKSQPEKEKSVQNRIIKALKAEGYFVKPTFGTQFQTGLPDLFAFHPIYGTKWTEVKRPTGSRLEDSQIELFSEWESRRLGVWVLTGPTPERLLDPPNWRDHYTGREVKEHRVERRASVGPERDLQEAIKRKLRATGWYCTDIHGHTYSHGFPDMYCVHRDWGARFIEVKTRPVFTPAQKRVFREMTDVGCPIWVMTDDDTRVLMKKCNIGDYADKIAVDPNPLRPC